MSEPPSPAGQPGSPPPPPPASRRPAQASAPPGVWSTARTVMHKEARDHARDKRSVFGALLLPILGPGLLIVGVRLGLRSQTEELAPLHVIGAARAPLLVTRLRADGVPVVSEAEDYPLEAAVHSGAAAAVLKVASDHAERLGAGRPATVQLVLDSSQPRSAALARRTQASVLGLGQRLGALRLVARGVSPALAQPLHLAPLDVATPEQRAAQVLHVIPLMLMVAALVGGLNIAIDTTAGERERHSLEPLLLNPAPHAGVVLGKWTIVAIAGALVAAAAALAFGLAGTVLELETIGLRLRLGPRELWWMVLWTAPLAAVGAALQMLVASFARTYKEAQTYLSLFVLLPMVPALVLMIRPMQNTLWASCIPALGQVTAVLDLLRGTAPPLSHLAVAWGSAGLYVALALVGLERLLRREKVIFGR